jgi:hypothetical protein
MSEPVTGILKLTGEVTGELGSPVARGVRRDPEQMYPPGPDLDDETSITHTSDDHGGVEIPGQADSRVLDQHRRASGCVG